MNTVVVCVIGQQSHEVIGRLSVKQLMSFSMKTIISDWFFSIRRSLMSLRAMQVTLVGQLFSMKENWLVRCLPAVDVIDKSFVGCGKLWASV